MLVRRSQFSAVVSALSATRWYGVDTETTGLDESDRLFSIIFHDGKQGFYFNFLEGSSTDPECVLPRAWIKELQPVFNNQTSLFFSHNFKFDFKMLEKEGLKIGKNIHCSMITALLLDNRHFDYSLDACAKRIGELKDDAVEKYIDEKKLYVMETVPGKKLKKKRKFFDRVPLTIMEKYAVQDANLHRKLGMYQLEEMKKLSDGPSLDDVYKNEHALLPVCVRMERRGIKISREYTEAGWSYETEKAESLQKEYKAITGADFLDSAVEFKKIFKKLGIESAVKTEKGNDSFSADALEEIDSPLAKMIVKIRRHLKYAGTYYQSFLQLADQFDVIHPDLIQFGAGTGRFSCAKPNLQNVPQEDSKNLEYYVRKCFIPHEGRVLHFIDYDAQEAKMMLDYAGEMNLIDEVLAGKDIHQATADLMRIERRPAKTINFMLLYGGGVGKLAAALGCSIPEAKSLRNQYFSKLPKVEIFMDQVQRVGRARGFIRTWLGRRLYLYDRDQAYKLVNALIQGGCADVVKAAMVKVDQFLEPYRTKMLLTVHDELIFEGPVEESYLMNDVKEIMESTYIPQNGLKLTCSISHSFESWGHPDKVKGIADEKARNIIQGKSSAEIKKDSALMVF